MGNDKMGKDYKDKTYKKLIDKLKTASICHQKEYMLLNKKSI